MIYDRATRLLPSERWVALCLAIAVLRCPHLAHATAEMLAAVVFATDPIEVYRTVYDATRFAIGVIGA